MKSRSEDCDKWFFDLEAHHPGFTVEKIKEMASYFVELSDIGKLYINYPMVESFFHM